MSPQIHSVDIVELVAAWMPPSPKPAAIGEYRVRFPKSQAVCRARWDGVLWRDLSNGFECYFQNVEWTRDE